jgi:hypothetical protein
MISTSSPQLRRAKLKANQIDGGRRWKLTACPATRSGKSAWSLSSSPSIGSPSVSQVMRLSLTAYIGVIPEAAASGSG